MLISTQHLKSSYQLFKLKRFIPSQVFSLIKALIQQFGQQQFMQRLMGEVQYQEQLDRLMNTNQVDFQDILKSIQTTKTTRFKGCVVSYFNLTFKQIQQINFVRLIQLNLSSCTITNIESLAFINMPIVQKINLTINYITQFKALAKLNHKFINQIILGSYLIPNCNCKIVNLYRINNISLKTILIFYTQNHKFDRFAQIRNLAKIVKNNQQNKLCVHIEDDLTRFANRKQSYVFQQFLYFDWNALNQVIKYLNSFDSL